MFVSSFFKKIGGKVQCGLCNRFCVLGEGEVGFCRVRKNVGGELVSLVFGKPIGLSVDPIEKKPFNHFKPGSSAFSFGCFGCNFSCLHCQNHDISREFSSSQIDFTPIVSSEEIVSQAIKLGCESIAFTYTEPTVFTEYALEVMRVSKKNGLSNVWVSNGYMSKEVREKILPFLDAINIDLKGDKFFYKKVCGNANMDFVKKNIKWFFKNKVHVELTNLIIPSFNDSKKQLVELIDFVASVSKNIPIHFSAFHPAYKLSNVPVTSVEKLFEAKKLGEEKLSYVYLGNIGSVENTYCKKCGSLLVERKNYSTRIIGLDSKGKCVNCGEDNNFVF